MIEHSGKILPIEVKSGKSYQRHSALSNVMEISNYSIDESYVFTNYNVEVNGKYVYFPIYMIMFLQDELIRLPEVSLEDLSFAK